MIALFPLQEESKEGRKEVIKEGNIERKERKRGRKQRKRKKEGK